VTSPLLLVFLITFAIIIMAKVAEMEGMSSFAWGAITFLSCLICAWYIPVPSLIIRVVIGLVISFSAMFITKVAKKRQ